MTDAVIVSTARTPLTKSWKGALNMTHGATLGGAALEAAAGIAAVATGRCALPCAEDTAAAAVPRGLMRAAELEVAVAEASALSTPERSDATAVS